MRARQREDRDFYRTPVECVKLINHMAHAAWDCCAGDGRISHNLDGVIYASDICPLQDNIRKQDFLAVTRPPIGIMMVVANPPFSLWREFIKHTIFTLKVDGLFLLPEEKLAGNTNKELQQHIYYRGTVSNLIKFDTPDGRVINRNGTLRCAWFLFKPIKNTNKIIAEYLHYEVDR